MGIDPGFSGALCVVDVSLRKILDMTDMPMTETKSILGPRPRSEIDVVKLTSFLRRWTNQGVKAVIERVNSSPQMGVVSAFRFGEGFGLVCGALVMSGFPIKFAHPSVWKRSMNLSSDKNLSILAAKEEFLADHDLFRLKRHDGRAEAALLALYGEKIYIPIRQS